MGFDATYQAIPHDCGLLEQARRDTELGEMLSSFVIWLSNWTGDTIRRGPSSQSADQLWGIAHALVRTDPALPKRNLYLCRTWDKFHYLLSADRRGQPTAPSDALFTRAVRGGDAIADHVRAGQGQPIRYLPPGEVRAVANALTRVTEEALRDHYDPIAMETAHVYKFRAEEAEEDWPWIVENFQALQRFYSTVAEYDEGVLFVLD